jgi:hypothetical protein
MRAGLKSEVLDQDQLNDLHAAVAAAGLQPITINTTEQLNFVRSAIAARSGASSDNTASHEWQRFPAAIRDRLGTETERKMTECIERGLSGDGGEDEWEIAREEGRALLRGEEDLEAMYDKIFSNPRMFQLARKMRTATRDKNCSGGGCTANIQP